MAKLLMPKATAVWLVDNTALTFDQIADFCTLHPLEVQGIADGDVGAGIKGQNPIVTGQVARDEIEKGEADPTYRLKMAKTSVEIPEPKKSGPRYTPVSRRQDKPDAIMWLLRYHPEMTDAQIGKLIGTTGPTIKKVKDRTHWNSANLKPVDPVTLGLCSQLDLDAAVQKAAARRARLHPDLVREDEERLAPVEESLGLNTDETGGFTAGPDFQQRAEREEEDVPSIESVFGAQPSANSEGDQPAEDGEKPADEDEEEKKD